MAGAKNEHGLTAKQEAFCHEYLKERNASAAYRAAYNTENFTDKSVWESASKLLSQPKVQSRLDMLIAEQSARHKVDVDYVSGMLAKAYQIAEGQGNAAAMVAAATNFGKLHGIFVEKTHNTNVDETQAHLDALRKLVGEKPDLKVVNG